MHVFFLQEIHPSCRLEKICSRRGVGDPCQIIVFEVSVHAGNAWWRLNFCVFRNCCGRHGLLYVFFHFLNLRATWRIRALTCFTGVGPLVRSTIYCTIFTLSEHLHIRSWQNICLTRRKVNSLAYFGLSHTISCLVLKATWLFIPEIGPISHQNCSRHAYVHTIACICCIHAC